MSWKGWLNWTSVDEVSGVGHAGVFHVSHLLIHVNVDKGDFGTHAVASRLVMCEPAP